MNISRRDLLKGTVSVAALAVAAPATAAAAAFGAIQFYKDRAGTIPAKVGDPVGFIRGGTMGDMIAPSDSARPILARPGYLEFDGVDDCLSTIE